MNEKNIINGIIGGGGIRKAQRNSSIEFLKIVAIIMIVLSHSMPDGDTSLYIGAIDINTVTTNIHLILAGFIKNMGQIGNNIFFVCSAWFLVDNYEVKSNKIAGMIGDCVFISISMLFIFSLLGYRFPKAYVFKQFFPVTFSNNWYLTCYLLLYAIHPILNYSIKEMEKEALLCFNICFFILYNCIGFVIGNGLFFYSNLIGFIGIYFFVAYTKLYINQSLSSKKVNWLLLFIGVIGWILSSWFTAVLGYNFSIFETQMQRWNNILNPCFILIAISSFNIVKSDMVINKMINYLSSLSLLIYMIHTTRIMRDYVRFDIFEYIKNVYGYEYLIIWILLFAIFNLLTGTLVAIIYNKTLQKYIHILFEHLCKVVIRVYMYIVKKILNLQ